MGYRIPIRIPKQFSVVDMEFAIKENDTIQYLLDTDKLFVFLPPDISDTSILGTYNSVIHNQLDKVVGKINEFIFTSTEISVDFELFERTLYGPMIKYLFSDIVKSSPQLVPAIIYDSQTNEIKNILEFTLYLNSFTNNIS